MEIFLCNKIDMEKIAFCGWFLSKSIEKMCCCDYTAPGFHHSDRPSFMETGGTRSSA